ncbi:TIM complex component Tim54 [Ascosphaera apis ARSEF 7405]|uniref:Mitochondrial import inner membrane translocase subunit TIM54 n=1 Tax=Ascosphaera apis ARSEF 7405 TaxID=392613 RepID=A0A167YHD2_9EURO|nr:TIM complex component Tim54 [Ascosphaera apis ARSEF 7405]
MADSGSKAGAAGTGNAAPAKPAAASAAPKPQNPAMRMMGMPNFRFKLPSRNWLIFLTITGSWFAAVIYDRREKRKIQQKWSHLVAHIAKEPLPSNELRRKLTVFLSAPPGDGLRSAREYFKEYVKPILVSGALDYEVIEGRKEGEIRAALAEKIRQRRRDAGESGAGASSPEDETTDAAKLLQEVRNNFGIHDEPGLKGDLVLGRNTWREYIRGIHEGWLGPLDAPVLETTEEDIPEVTPLSETPVVQQTTSSPPSPSATTTETTTSTSTTETTTPPSIDNQTSTEPPTPTKSEEDTKAAEKKKEEEKKEAEKKKGPTPSYLLPSDYASQPLPPTLPDVLEPSCPIYFPHILGFLNTPIRMYRFLNKRKVAESVGEEVAALVLAAQVREYKYGIEHTHTHTHAHDTSADASPVSSESSEPNNKALEPQWEQASLLEIEEADWHKSARRERPDALEREWLDPIVLDSRIASRMRRFVVPEEERERSQRIFEGQEWIRGEEKPADVPLWQMVKDYMGFGEDNHPSRKVVVGNYEGEFDE